jgi:transposase
MKLAPELLRGILNAYVIGDSAYDARALAEQLQAQGCDFIVPSNPTRAVQRELDRHLYKERRLVENFFQCIKRFRRVAMRFEKLSRNFLAFVLLASVLVGLV